MNLASLNASWRLASFTNKILLLAVLVLSAAVLILAGAAINNRDRIVILPPTIDSPYTVNWQSATPEYHKSMALFFTGVIGTITPRTVDYSIGVIERFCEPAVAQEITRRLRAMAAQYEFRESTSSSWFEGDKMAWEQASGKVFVIGRLISVALGGNQTQKPVVYEYKISIREGQPRISHFDSYEGSMPHTLEWVNNPNQASENGRRLARDAQAAAAAAERLTTQESNQRSIDVKRAIDGRTQP